MSTSDDRLSSVPTASPPLAAVASGNCLRSDTVSILEAIQETLALPTSPPLEVQPILITLQHLLLTNNPPSSQDSVILLACVSIIDDLIQKLDAAIAFITSSQKHEPGQEESTPLDEQRTQRAHLQHLRKQVHSVDSVVRRVPQEIWQEIFIFVGASNYDGKLSVYNLRNPLYVVGQVCRTWRTASHRHPQLWSQILIGYKAAPTQREGLLRLRTVLERARSVLLDFVFLSDCDAPQLSIALLTLLTEYSHQWRSAQVLRLTPSEARPLELVRGRIPELQKLSLEFSRGEPDAVDVGPTDIITAFEFAPKLLHVWVRHFPLSQVVLDSSVKQNLQSLTTTYYCDDEATTEPDLAPSLVEILAEYPSLDTLHVGYNEESSAWGCHWPAPGASRTVYTGLTNLCAIEGDSLNRISLPNLAKLAIGLCTEVLNPDILPCLVSLIRHSSCRLAHLVLSSTAWDEASLVVLLALVPDLDYLKLMFGGTRGVDDTLQILTRCLSTTGDGGPKYVPRLETLNIDMCSTWMTRFMWSFIDTAFLDMVSMRAEGCLTRVNLRQEYRNIYR